MPSTVRNSIIFIIIVILLLFLARSCKDDSNPVTNLSNEVMEKTSEIAQKTTEIAEKTGNAIVEGTDSALAKLGSFFSVTLPNNTTLSIPEFGIENKLLGFIKGDKPIDKNTWFEFDRINFMTGSTSLSTESEEQISNIAAILQAYENTSIKIGGYTDNTGSEAVNMRLSQARADSVKRALVSQGISGDRLTTEGYGPAHPVASNDTEEGRAQNRRIAVRLTAK